MTLDQINECLKGTTGSYIDNGTYIAADINIPKFAAQIATLVRTEMLLLAHANTIVSNDANELYKDLQAYDRFERGLNY